MIANAKILLSPHVPAMIYGYVVQESDLYQ